MNRVAITIIAAMLAVSSWAGDVSPRTTSVRHERAVVTPLVMQARQALFEQSQLDRARQLAQQQLQQNPWDVEALFIEMEAAALEADTTAELHSALKLCELRSAQRDPRVTIAAARILDLAGNTEDFRTAIPRIQAMLNPRREPPVHANYLHAALVAAAADGAPGLEMDKVAREAGLVTDWRIAGPFGNYGNLEFDQHWAPEHDALLAATSDGHAVERLHFSSGMFRIPAYFSRGGVFYGAAEITSAGATTLRVESAGTYEVMLDGAVVLRNDSRFRSTPEIAWRNLRLARGTHRLVVKFLTSATPFRIAMVPATAPAPAKSRGVALDYAPESSYISAAQKYWAGDYNGVISDLDGAQRNNSAVVDFLVYQAWTHVAQDSPEATAMLNATVTASSTALAAEYELASRANDADRTDEALSRLGRVIQTRENFAPAQQLLAQIAIRLNWPLIAANALEVPLRVHPSCDVLLQAYRFFAGHARYERAGDIRKQFADCAPDTLALVQSLSESGEYAKAATAAQSAVAQNPLDRTAREMLVRQLAMAGEAVKAHAAAEELAALAPNSDLYRRMAQIAPSQLDSLLDDVALRASEFAAREPFYSKYRRDGVQMVRNTEDRKFSGGPAVMLVHDRVARLWPDGRISVYVHQLVRVLDRDGIEKYGEAVIPRDAEVLELRTIKADGTIAEPELIPNKASISMPALAPGDAIDEEYVQHYADRGGLAEHAAAFQHTCGSVSAPILYSRFAAIIPAANTGVYTQTAPGILPARSDVVNDVRVYVWDKNDIAQSVEETATARGDVLPVVGLRPDLPGGWTEARNRFRNDLVDALYAGPRVQQLATALRSQQAEAKAREIFRAISDSVRPTGPFNPEDMISAEQTLACHSGSRTVAVLAVARAAGLEADLVLARNAGTIINNTRPALDRYTRPLIKFRFADGSESFADAETDGLAFGAVPPTIERHDALLVPVLTERAPVQVASSPIMSLPPNAEEQSVASGDVTLQADGSLVADVTIRMGAWRSAQMRSILAGIDPSQRPRFFQQLASRIFAGAEQVTGTVTHEHEPDRPLQLVLHCRAPRYVNLAQATTDLDQLVPALGLKKMYSSGARRKYPLFIDTPLVERAEFRLHLPAGLEAAHGTPELNVSGTFGSYSLAVRQAAPGVLDIQRSFRIPVQVVAPERYADFSAFAARIDDAERQRIALENTSEAVLIGGR